MGEVCPLIPHLEKCLEEIMELAESGMRYTQMPHVMEVGYSASSLTNRHMNLEIDNPLFSIPK